MGAKIKRLLEDGKVVRVFTLGQFLGPKVVEIVALHGGFDAFWFDHEHVGVTPEAVEQAARACRAAGLDSFVRVAATDYATIMRYLEVGAGGVLAAMVNDAEQAERVVRWAKFAPRGRRGMNGANVDGDYGLIPMAEYTRRANDETFIGVQIETAEAVENIGAIAAVPDIDLLFIGPADLSQSLGVVGELMHPRCLEAIDRVAAACARTGRAWGIVPASPEYARRMLDRGCQMLEVGSDVGSFHRGIRASKALYPELFGSPAPEKASPTELTSR